MKKNDLILILIVVGVSILVFYGYGQFYKKEGKIVRVVVDGQTTGKYDLNRDAELEVNGGTNILVIKNGKASIKSADCPDKICVHHGAISKNGESIICLPNKVVVQIVGSRKENGVDVMAE